MVQSMQGQYVEQVSLQYESEPAQYVDQYVVATNDHEAKVIFHFLHISFYLSSK